METPLWAQVPETIESYAKTTAILVGGAWALYRFGLTREREPALAFDIQHSVKATGEGPRLVAFDVAVTNKSKVKLAAGSTRPAYKDSLEQLNYPVSLLLRPVNGLGKHGTSIRWFDGGEPSPRSDDIELDLLNDYLADIDSDFYMEPGETYQLSAIVFLEPGTYVAMVTFIGERMPDDFWRRTTVVRIE